MMDDQTVAGLLGVDVGKVERLPDWLRAFCRELLTYGQPEGQR